MLTKNRLASSAIVLAVGLFAAGAFAGNEHAAKGHDAKGHDAKGHDVTFEELDEDRDGYISNAEFQTTPLHEQVDHDALDTDDDGRLNRTEFAAFELMSQDISSEQRMKTDRSWQGDQTEPRRSTDEPFQASDPTRDPGRSEPDR